MRPWIRVVAIIGLGLLIRGVPVARAGTPEEIAAARELTRRAEASYNLGHYSEAAAEFEAAYRVTLDPALLFNVAQSWRLGNETEKALTVYRSYLRTAPANAANRDEAQRWRQELEHKLAGAPKNTPPPAAPPKPAAPAPPPAAPPKAAAPPPPAASPSSAPSAASPPPPAAVPGAPPAIAPPPPGGSSSTTTVTLTSPSTPPSPAAGRPIYKRWWFWVIVGGAAAGVTASAILLSGDQPNPDCLGISPCGTF